jgi:trk system potassium uptake protein TrkA
VTFSKGSVEIVEHRIPEGGALAGMKLSDMSRRFKSRVLVALVDRGGRPLIPNGDTVLLAGDRLSITGSTDDLRKFFHEIGEYKKPVRRVMIMGGGRTAVYLTRMLQESGIDVTIVERSRARCDELCDAVPKAHVVCGDCTHADVLLEDGILAADGFVSLSGDDGDNIITSLYARSCHVGKIVTTVNREHFAQILFEAGLDSVVAPKELVAQQLARYVRALGNSPDSSVEMLYRLAGGSVEVLEFCVREGAACTLQPLSELKLRPDVLIVALIRGNKSIRPDGSTRILPGDHAVVVTAHKLGSLDDILETKP